MPSSWSRFVYCVLLLLFQLKPNDAIKKKFANNDASKSLLCNSCAMIADTLNHTLFENNGEFEANVGFRLDSSGKKIRKNSQWLKIHIALEDIHCNWRNDVFKVAKRKSGLLYLLSKEDAHKNDKFNKASKEKAQSENLAHFMQVSPNLLKPDSKYNKMLDDMCLSLTELFDEWLHEKRAEFKDSDKNTDISQSLNLTDLCLKQLTYKNQRICKDEMMNFKVDLQSNKIALSQKSETKQRWFKLPHFNATQWFIIDLSFCYLIILTVLALFCVLDAPILLCKLSLIALLLCPNYLYRRNPGFGNFSTWFLTWWWYAIRFYDMFCNEHYFRNKSFLFCWCHSGAMKNMFKVSVQSSMFNWSALAVMCANLVFMIKIFPYIFNELIPNYAVYNVCHAAIYPNICIKILEIFSFTCSILYTIDHGAVFLLNLAGYRVAYDMVQPWKSYSLEEFWGKRWNQFVAYLLKSYVYKPMMQFTNHRQLAVCAVFTMLGVIHAFPMWLDGFSNETLVVAFVWFILQPICLWIEEKFIISVSFGVGAINTVLHCILTFALLLGSFFISLFASCYAMEWNG